jgi:predicted nucleic acid-binding protein
MALTSVDTSVLIPAVAPWHTQHRNVDEALRRVANLRMIGHVLLETYSWLTRSRPRTSPQVAGSLLRALPGPLLTLSVAGHEHLLDVAGRRGLMGGAAYDALVAATALEAEARLLTRDERAVRAYESIGVDFELI